MPASLQELSPKPDFEAIDRAQIRVPKLGARGRDKPSSTVGTTTPPITPSAPTPTRSLFTEKDSKESLRSSDEGTLATPTNAPSVAPWDWREKKSEQRPATAQSNSFTTSTNERHSFETSKQPFRQEVFPLSIISNCPR